jgi:beta-galactosidase
LDLAGFPKDAYYLYQSEWTDKPVLHLFPHWNWKPGQTIDVWAYTNLDKVELFLNGKSLGSKQKAGDHLHLSWSVPFTSGKLSAIGYKDGKEVGKSEISTAGRPVRIMLDADRSAINANGTDLSFVKVNVTDSAGTLVPDAMNLIRFKISCKGFIAGVDNGNQTSHESLKKDYRQAFNGLCLVVIQSKKSPGKIMLEAKSDAVAPASVEIVSR